MAAEIGERAGREPGLFKDIGDRRHGAQDVGFAADRRKAARHVTAAASRRLSASAARRI